jgi:hypothetical protein
MHNALSSAALVAHELGLATGFGGTIFGQFAMDPATRALASAAERGRLSNEAWKRYSPVSTASTAIMALTWLAGRSFISGRRLGRGMRRLVLVKDLFVGAAAASGLATYVLGRELWKEGSFPLESGNTPSDETPGRAKALLMAVNMTGLAHLAATGGALATTAMLNIKAGRSSRWGALAKTVLP